ncbi:MAG TPA: hypothetical protein ENN79_10955 [Desulfobacteraceae bacterium]|nr:hypothetical protein [Desulfobacteraceae bacterium]
MSIESELRKMLENNEFEPKATKKGSIWTYYHPKYMVVNYHINGHIRCTGVGRCSDGCRLAHRDRDADQGHVSSQEKGNETREEEGICRGQGRSS